TVGPVGERPQLLSSCYRKSLDLLVSHKLRSIAFPCISTGVFGYPQEAAAKVALETVRTWLSTGSNLQLVDRVIFCLFADEDVQIYKRLLGQYFPAATTTTTQ